MPKTLICNKEELAGEYLVDGRPQKWIKRGDRFQLASGDERQEDDMIARGLALPYEIPKISYEVTIIEPRKRELGFEAKEADRQYLEFPSEQVDRTDAGPTPVFYPAGDGDLRHEEPAPVDPPSNQLLPEPGLPEHGTPHHRGRRGYPVQSIGDAARRRQS